MATLSQVDVVEITEEPHDIDVIEVDIGLDPNASHEMGNTDSNVVSHGSHAKYLDEDPGMNEDSEAETRIMNADRASRATESPEADEFLNASEECLAGEEGSCLVTEDVENVATVKIPRQKSKWLADWIIEAGDWEGDGWLDRRATLSLRCSASEEDMPIECSRNGLDIDSAARRRLREKFLPARRQATQ